MRKTLALAIVILSQAVLPAAAVVVVSEEFESFADTAAMQAVWINPVAGTPDEGTLATEFGNPGQSGLNPGTAANPANMNQRTFAAIAPTADAPLRLRADIYDDATTTGKRQTISALQGTAADPANDLEMGFWDLPPAPFYAYRVQLFESGNVNWDLFDLPADKDQPAEVGPGWHRYEAIIREDSLRLSLDLYADGIVDAVNVVSASAWPLPRGFDRIRWGGPLGQPSPGGEAYFDNILLEIVLLGDTNNDAHVDGLDVDPFIVRLLTGPYLAEADMNQDGSVNGLDVDPFVRAILATGPVQAVPEPSTWILLVAAALAGTGTSVRRRG